MDTQLVEMGFPLERSRLALKKTNFKGVQEAMDWLLQHADDPDVDVAVVESTESGSEATAQAAEETGNETAMSLQCNDCGKKFRTSQDCEAHAARTQHVNFSESTDEIKPLTEEEKKAKLEELQRRVKEKREARAAEEQKELVMKVKSTRQTAKEIADAKRAHEELEMKKRLAETVRQKELDAKAKARVMQQLAEDKAARAAAKSGAQQSVAPSSTTTVSPSSSTTTTTTTVAAPTSTGSSSASTPSVCKLQIKLLSGSPIVNSFKAEALFQEVLDFVISKSGYTQPFTLVMVRPHRVYSDADANSTLLSLGLAPSAVLAVQRS